MQTPVKNRRQSHRARVAQPVRLRPFDNNYPEEICTTENVSRGGFYFITRSAHYFKGMELQVTRNFQPDDPSNREENADVVRVDKMTDGRWGVAVRVLLRAKLSSETEFDVL